MQAQRLKERYEADQAEADRLGALRLLPNRLPPIFNSRRAEVPPKVIDDFASKGIRQLLEHLKI